MKVKDLAQELKISIKEMLGILSNKNIRIKNANHKLTPMLTQEIKNEVAKQEQNNQKAMAQEDEEKNIKLNTRPVLKKHDNYLKYL